MKTHQTPIGKNDEWLTPKWILNALGDFYLDPCAPINRPWDTADTHYSVREDGLSLPWHGRVWLNPPFKRGEREKWMRKMAMHRSGIMLIPAATETRAFFDLVWDCASAVCFLRTRPHFHYVTGEEARANCGCALVLVAYSQSDARVLENCGLGHFVKVERPQLFEKEAA